MVDVGTLFNNNGKVAFTEDKKSHTQKCYTAHLSHIHIVQLTPKYVLLIISLYFSIIILCVDVIDCVVRNKYEMDLKGK